LCKKVDERVELATELDNLFEEEVRDLDKCVEVGMSEVSEGYTTALGPKYGASEGLKRGPLATRIISF
jgi:hypothetical protein